MTHGIQITPLAQLIATSDSSRASGYQRVLLSPGVEFDMKRTSLYADVEVPVFQDVVGNQLVSSPWMLKVAFTYHF